MKRQSPTMWIIKDHYVVLGDRHRRSNRTTTATEILIRLKEEYKAANKCGRRKTWIPLAIQDFSKRLAKQFPHLNPDERQTVVVKINSDAVGSDNMYGYLGDSAPTFGVGHWDEALTSYLTSRDPPTLTSEISKHMTRLQQLFAKEPSKRPPIEKIASLAKTLNFFQEKIDEESRGNCLAHALLDSLKPINSLQKLWIMLEKQQPPKRSELSKNLLATSFFETYVFYTIKLFHLRKRATRMPLEIVEFEDTLLELEMKVFRLQRSFISDRPEKYMDACHSLTTLKEKLERLWPQLEALSQSQGSHSISTASTTPSSASTLTTESRASLANHGSSGSGVGTGHEYGSTDEDESSLSVSIAPPFVDPILEMESEEPGQGLFEWLDSDPFPLSTTDAFPDEAMAWEDAPVESLLNEDSHSKRSITDIFENSVPKRPRQNNPTVHWFNSSDECDCEVVAKQDEKQENETDDKIKEEEEEEEEDEEDQDQEEADEGDGDEDHHDDNNDFQDQGGGFGGAFGDGSGSSGGYHGFDDPGHWDQSGHSENSGDGHSSGSSGENNGSNASYKFNKASRGVSSLFSLRSLARALPRMRSRNGDSHGVTPQATDMFKQKLEGLLTRHHRNSSSSSTSSETISDEDQEAFVSDVGSKTKGHRSASSFSSDVPISDEAEATRFGDEAKALARSGEPALANEEWPDKSTTKDIEHIEKNSHLKGQRSILLRVRPVSSLDKAVERYNRQDIDSCLCFAIQGDDKHRSDLQLMAERWDKMFAQEYAIGCHHDDV